MKLTFKGVIDCNTEIILDNISYEECEGIKKFIKALRISNCSFVGGSVSTTKTDKDYKILNVGDRIWLTKRPEDLIHHCCSARFKMKLDKPIEKKIYQIVIDNSGIKYQVNGGHIKQDMIGKIAFLNYEDAVKNMDNNTILIECK